jgi:hypothetical protein
MDLQIFARVHKVWGEGQAPEYCIDPSCVCCCPCTNFVGGGLRSDWGRFAVKVALDSSPFYKQLLDGYIYRGPKWFLKAGCGLQERRSNQAHEWHMLRRYGEPLQIWSGERDRHVRCNAVGEPHVNRDNVLCFREFVCFDVAGRGLWCESYQDEIFRTYRRK